MIRVVEDFGGYLGRGMTMLRDEIHVETGRRFLILCWDFDDPSTINMRASGVISCFFF